VGGTEDRLHSGGEREILQDYRSEHRSLTKTESDPPGDLSLPGKLIITQGPGPDPCVSVRVCMIVYVCLDIKDILWFFYILFSQ
jgi:hypothetical protein